MGAGKMTDNELLPCPFCGGKEITVGLKPTGYFAICNKCAVRTGQYFDENSVIKRWNTRTNMPRKKYLSVRGAE